MLRVSQYLELILLIPFATTYVEDQEANCQYRVDGSADEEAVCEEVIVASQLIRSCKHEVLLSIERAHIVIVRDVKLVVTFVEVLMNHAKELLESREACRPHPHNEVLVFHICPLD